jgi:succinate-acetate transporter protein
MFGGLIGTPTRNGNVPGGSLPDESGDTPQQQQQQQPPPPPMNRSLISKDLPSATRLVAVRYFLDRSGYGLHNSAARLWFDVPARAQPHDVGDFLRDQQIALEGLLVEVYIDRFQSFMMLDACAAAGIEWDFGDTCPDNPGTINIRLTDLGGGSGGGGGDARTPSPGMSGRREIANATPMGLFAFSMTVGLECASFLIVLVPGSLSDYFVLVWTPSMLFVGGLLQFTAGLFELIRGNIYGGTAFLSFGGFWLSTGLNSILQLYFATDGTTAQELMADKSPWYSTVKNIYILAFVLVLLVQTFAMNKLSSGLIALLATKIFFGIFAPWSTGVFWVEFVLGWMLSIFGFYIFAVELTNQVYHRELLPEYKWSAEDSPGEVFGAQGKEGTLQSRAAQLRQARFVLSPRTLREAKAEIAPGLDSKAAATTAAPSSTALPSESEK